MRITIGYAISRIKHEAPKNSKDTKWCLVYLTCRQIPRSGIEIKNQKSLLLPRTLCTRVALSVLGALRAFVFKHSASTQLSP